MTRRARFRMAVAFALLPLQGCGYALVGHGVSVDPSIKRIGVPLFKDTTGKPGLDQKVTAKVVEELLKRGRFDVVQQSEGVDALVEGEVRAYQVTPVSFSGVAGDLTQTQTQATRYAIRVIAAVKYTKVGEKEPIWQNDTFSFSDEYDITGDPNTFFDREDQSIDRLLQNFARNLVAAMLEAF
jgi:hypothetical protein